MAPLSSSLANGEPSAQGGSTDLFPKIGAFRLDPFGEPLQNAALKFQGDALPL
jgi:hypothetical protein